MLESRTFIWIKKKKAIHLKAVNVLESINITTIFKIN